MDELTKIAMIGTARFTGPLTPDRASRRRSLCGPGRRRPRTRATASRRGAVGLRVGGPQGSRGHRACPSRSPPETKARGLATRWRGCSKPPPRPSSAELLLDCFAQMSARRVVLPTSSPAARAGLEGRRRPPRRDVGAQRARPMAGAAKPSLVVLPRSRPRLATTAPTANCKRSGTRARLTIGVACSRTVRARDPHRGRDWIADRPSRGRSRHTG